MPIRTKNHTLICINNVCRKNVSTHESNNNPPPNGERTTGFSAQTLDKGFSATAANRSKRTTKMERHQNRSAGNDPHRLPFCRRKRRRRAGCLFPLACSAHLRQSAFTGAPQSLCPGEQGHAAQKCLSTTRARTIWLAAFRTESASTAARMAGHG